MLDAQDRVLQWSTSAVDPLIAESIVRKSLIVEPAGFLTIRDAAGNALGAPEIVEVPANSGTSVADWHACIASHTAGGAVVVTAGSEGAPRRRKREPFGVEELGQTSAAGVRVVRLVRERRPTQAAL